MAFTLSSVIIQTYAQGIYDSLTLDNFRNYKPFKESIEPGNFKPEILEAAIYFLTNEVRIKQNLKYLPYNIYLANGAKLHSHEMATKNFFNHTNPRNRKLREPEDRAEASGIINPKISENIIEGFIIEYQSNVKVLAPSPGVFLNQASKEKLPYRTYLALAEVIMKDWMNSKGHRKNILSKNAVQLGCGVSIYQMKNFNHMPAVKATQLFQWWEPVKTR